MFCIYRGMQKVSDEEVKSEYEGTHVALESMNTFYGREFKLNSTKNC
jgi:hypothetical protein